MTLSTFGRILFPVIGDSAHHILKSCSHLASQTNSQLKSPTLDQEIIHVQCRISSHCELNSDQTKGSVAYQLHELPWRFPQTSKTSFATTACMLKGTIPRCNKSTPRPQHHNGSVSKAAHFRLQQYHVTIFLTWAVVSCT